MNYTLWREGAILIRENSKAEIIQTYGKREIFIKVIGRDRKEFLAIIIDQIDRINTDFKKIKVRKMIPCNCDSCVRNEEKKYYDFNLLKKYISNNIKTERCPISLKEVMINNLINNALGSSNQREDCNIYISYSEKNFADLELFKKHLKPFLYGSKMSAWDKSMILPGENVNTKKSEKINNSEIIISLISVDYLTDEDCYGWELVRALELLEINDILFIPVIIRECDYKNFNFNHFKPIIVEEKPIFSHAKLEYSLKIALGLIMDSIKIFQKKKISFDDNL